MTKILVVDDESSIRDLTSMILEDHGYMVITAENGTEAIEKFRREKPNLIFLDIRMPGISGFETCKELKRLNPTAKVVIFTVSESEDDRKRAREMKCDGYFLKPFTAEDLIWEVEKQLGKAESP